MVLRLAKLVFKAMYQFFKANEKLILRVFRILLFLGALWYIYHFFNGNHASLWLMKKALTGFSTPFFIAVLLGLMLTSLFNWGIEAKKFQWLMGTNIVGFSQCYKAVLAGAASSLLFPNRSGEVFTRIIFIPQGFKLKSIYGTFLGSLAQLIITLFFGELALSYLLFQGTLLKPMDISLYFIGGGAFLFLTCIYFYAKIIIKWIPLNWIPYRLRKDISYIKATPKELLIKVLLLSILRYMMFYLPFVILIIFVSNQLLIPFLAVAFYYLVLTLIPSTGLSELALRGAGMVYVLKYFNIGLDVETKIILISYFIWILNVIFPALIGAFFLLFKPKKNS